MKIIKLFKQQISLLLAVLIMYSSCTTQENIPIDKSMLDNFSGKDIFKGLFFSEGDFVNQVPTLNRLKVKRDIFKENQLYTSNYLSKNTNGEIIDVSLEITKRTDDLVEKVSEINPNLFNELKNSLKSSSPDIIEEAIDKSSLTIKTALYQDENFKEGISIVKGAYEKAGVDPRKYDFTKKDHLEKYNTEIVKYLKTTDKYKNLTEEKLAAFVIVFYVTVVVLVAWGVVVFAAVGGEVFLAYANFIFMWNWAFVFDKKENNSDDLLRNTLIKELAELNRIKVEGK